MSSSKKPGDWDCPACDHLNFSRRDSCQRCGEQRPLDGGLGSNRGGDYGYGGARGGSFGYGSGYGSAGRGYGGSGFQDDVRPGDWYCNDCNAHNFASRTGCFKCGSFKDEPLDGRRYDRRGDPGGFSPYGAAGPGAGARGSGWKSGDWICSRTGCKEHNFASRLECFRCSAPRESSGM